MALQPGLEEFAFADTSISNQKTCRSRNRGSNSYFKLADEEVDWNEAWRLCYNNGSTLPVICNQLEQDDLTNFLKANEGSSAAWTSGKKIPFDRWTWVDGQPFNNRGAIKVEHETYTHVAINVDGSYKARNPNSNSFYLCQYSGSSCNSQNDTGSLRVTYGCVRASDDDRSWYDARNQCLKNGGDLAILTNADLGILGNLRTRRINDKLFSIGAYWIGLRNSTWRWISQETVQSGGSGEEIEYSNWSNDIHHTSYECISIDSSTGEWKPVRCTDRKKVVCQGNHTTSSTKTSTMSRMSSSRKTSTMSKMSSNPTQGISESTTQTITQGHSNALLTSVVVVGLCVIVISNIIVAMVVRKYYLRRANTSSPSEATETKCYQDLETTRRQANPDGTYTELQLQPVYEEVSKQRGH